MAEGLGRDVGGIAGLLALIDEHGEAIEFDLWQLSNPRRLEWLGTERLEWRDLRIIVEHLPRTSALGRATLGKDAKWGFSEQLAATQIDALNMLIWMNSEDGRKNRRRPKPIPRPGIDTGEQNVGRDPLPVDEMASWLGWETPSDN